MSPRKPDSFLGLRGSRPDAYLPFVEHIKMLMSTDYCVAHHVFNSPSFAYRESFAEILEVNLCCCFLARIPRENAA